MFFFIVASVFVPADADSEDEGADLKVIVQRYLTLKGQMLYMGDWDSIIFLGTPV